MHYAYASGPTDTYTRKRSALLTLKYFIGGNDVPGPNSNLALQQTWQIIKNAAHDEI